jgi:Flp pilus assembly protein TadD
LEPSSDRASSIAIAWYGDRVTGMYSSSWKAGTLKSGRAPAMLRRTVAALLFNLLISAASWAQTSFLGLAPGQSTREEAVRVLGQPVRTVTAELLEFSPQEGTGKIEVEVRKRSSVIDRIELHFLRPIVRSALVDRLSLPATPETQRTNESGKLEEFFGGAALVVLTYVDSETASGVASLGYYSRELFESAASGPRGGSATESNRPKQTPATPSTAPPAPGAGDQFVHDGISRSSAGDFDGAIATFSRAIELDPRNWHAWFNRARAYFDKGNYDGVIADSTKAIELGNNLNLAYAYGLRGTGWAAKGDLEQALVDHTQAIKLDPYNALAYNNRANDRLQMGNWKGALADCNQSIALDPTSPLPYSNRGYVHAYTGNHAQAITDWQKAIDLQPAYRGELQPLIEKLRMDLRQR